jgi:hypothetical protein
MAISDRWKGWFIFQESDMPGQSTRFRYLRTHTWYGLPVEIAVSSDNLHRVAVPGLAVPHPGLVNLIVRQGLPGDVRLELTARHELGHLQTLPVPLLHLALLLWPRRGPPSGSRVVRWLVALLTHQAVWEVAAEAYVVATDRRAIQAPRPMWARTLYAGFWSGMSALAAAGTLFLLRRRNER